MGSYYTMKEAMNKAQKMMDFITKCDNLKSTVTVGGMDITYNRNSLLGQIRGIRKPSLDQICKTRKHVDNICQRVIEEKDLRGSALFALRYDCYAHMWDSLNQKSKYVVNGVLNRKINLNDVSEKMLYMILTHMDVCVSHPEYGTMDNFWRVEKKLVMTHSLKERLDNAPTYKMGEIE